MGYKFFDNKGFGLVWFSKRHPITGVPITLKRKVKEKSKMKMVERELIALVERKIVEKTVPKWKVVLESYYSSLNAKKLTLKTIYDTKACLDATTCKWLGLFINEISTAQIRDLILQDFGNHDVRYQKLILRNIKQVFEFAVENEWIVRNPVPQLAFRVGDKIKKVLTEEQVKAFLNAAKEMNSAWYPLWVTALYTGLRSGELYALTWDKVNFVERNILVDRAWNNKDGFKETKSGDDRVVEIAQNLLLVLQHLKVAKGTTDFVLPRIRSWDYRKNEILNSAKGNLCQSGMTDFLFKI